MSIDDTSKPSRPSRTDWKRLDAMTETELEAAIVSDPDSFAPHSDSLAHGQLVFPNGQSFLMVPLSKEDADWLNRHRQDSSQLAASLVHEYVQKHQ
jgi:hypothetical protein